jgi:hypothetical protein
MITLSILCKGGYSFIYKYPPKKISMDEYFLINRRVVDKCKSTLINLEYLFDQADNFKITTDLEDDRALKDLNEHFMQMNSELEEIKKQVSVIQQKFISANAEKA